MGVVLKTDAWRPRRGDAGVRLHGMLRMHPFLKHRILGKGMRDLIYNTPYGRQAKRSHIVRDSMLSKMSRLRRYADFDYERRRNAELLNQVIRDVEELRFGKRIASEGECSVNGSWVAEAGGRHIDITHQQKGNGVSVKMRNPLQKHRLGFLGMRDWNATLKLPFKDKSNYVILVAINSKEHVIATFMGECRVCRSHDLVQGQWFVAHHSRSCESMGATEQLIGDVWRRDKLTDIRQRRLEELKQQKNSTPQPHANQTATTTNTTVTTTKKP